MPAAKKPAARRPAIAAEAQHVEAIPLERGKKIEFKGHTFTLPDNPEIGFFYESEQGHFISAVAELLGPVAFTQLRALRPTMEQFNEICDQIAEAYGFDQGN